MKDLKIPLFVAPTEVIVMRRSYPMIFSLVVAIVSMSPAAYAQDNPYRVEEGWAKYPEGRKWGSTSGVDVDRERKQGIPKSLRRFGPCADIQV